MFQVTRRRLALWYTGVTAVLLLLFATGFYIYVRTTLVERIDDTLNHVVEVVQRSLVVEPTPDPKSRRVNLEASFPSQAAVEDDHIDLEWFNPEGKLLWSTFSAPLDLPLHPNYTGETVYAKILPNDPLNASPYLDTFALRQVTQRVQLDDQILGYLRVSHPWFEVTKPSRQLIRDLSLGVVLVLGAVSAIGWLLSGLAIAPIRESYQRLKQFTADASHELRNPLAVIQTNVQVALADPDPSLQQEQLRVIERLTRRLGRLVDDLLFLARQDSNQTGLAMNVVPLDKLLKEVIEEQQAVAQDRGVTLGWQVMEPIQEAETEKLSERSRESYDRSLGGNLSGNSGEKNQVNSSYCILGNADQLTRLFTNLISNALQYTPAGGLVQVQLQRIRSAGGECLQVQLRDTGIGIPADSLSQIFDRFYRVDPARTASRFPSSALPQGQVDRSTGSGLGLAIAKVIVDNHHGQIQVSSVPHQGTTFTVTLPCPKHAALAPATGNSANSPHGK